MAGSIGNNENSASVEAELGNINFKNLQQPRWASLILNMPQEYSRSQEIMTCSSTLSPSYELPAETNHSQLSTFPRPCPVYSRGKLKACDAVCSAQWFLVFLQQFGPRYFHVSSDVERLRSYHVLGLPEGHGNYPHRQNHRS